MGGANGDVVAIAQHKGNLYQMTFTKVYKADAPNFVHSRAEGNMAELWHR